MTQSVFHLALMRVSLHFPTLPPLVDNGLFRRGRGVQLFIVTNAMKTVTRPTGLRAAQLEDSRYSTNANQPIEPIPSHEVPTRFHAAE